MLNSLPFLIGCSNRNPEIKKVNQFISNKGGAASRLYPEMGDVYNFLNEQHLTHPEETALYEIGETQKNNLPIPLIQLGYISGTPSKSILIVAGTHGDEAAAVVAVNYLIKTMLQPDQIATLISKRLLLDIVPVHNPEGYLENQRENDNGIDINRNFPFGNVEAKQEAETKALVALVNKHHYDASIFLHSANEIKYENLVRVPLEYTKVGTSAFPKEYRIELLRLSRIIIDGGNKTAPEIPWHSSSEMVDVTGIASDWCMSGFMTKEFKKLIKKACVNPHPSVTIELCYPKQPMEKQRLVLEQQELYNIVMNVINKF